MGYGNISPRKTGYRHVTPIRTFNVPTRSEVLNHFRQAKGDIYDFRESVNRSNAGNKMLRTAQGCVLRSSVVMACSAFDLYVHELLYLTFFFMRNRQIENPSDEFKSFKKSWSEGEPRDDRTFYSMMTEKYGWKTMSNPENFTETLSDMGVPDTEELYATILSKNGKTVLPEQAKSELERLMRPFYKRRNRIAHSYDYNLPNGQEDITDDFVTEYVKLLSCIVDTLSEHMNRYLG